MPLLRGIACHGQKLLDQMHHLRFAGIFAQYIDLHRHSASSGKNLLPACADGRGAYQHRAGWMNATDCVRARPDGHHGFHVGIFKGLIKSDFGEINSSVHIFLFKIKRLVLTRDVSPFGRRMHRYGASEQACEAGLSLCDASRFNVTIRSLHSVYNRRFGLLHSLF